jgi:hypothetical protein
MQNEEKYRYLVTIQFEEEITVNDNAKTVKRAEPWLINAVSVTDAEAIANKEIAKMGTNGRTFEYRVKDVKETKIARVIE